MMTLELRIVLIVVSVLTTLLIMGKIRQSELQIEDSMFWIGLSAILILFSVFPQTAALLASLAGTYTTSNFIFLAIIFLLMVKLFYMTLKMSQLESKVKELVQEMALAENRNGGGKGKKAETAAGAEATVAEATVADVPDARKQ